MKREALKKGTYIRGGARGPVFCKIGFLWARRTAGDYRGVDACLVVVIMVMRGAIKNGAGEDFCECVSFC